MLSLSFSSSMSLLLISLLVSSFAFNYEIGKESTIQLSDPTADIHGWAIQLHTCMDVQSNGLYVKNMCD